mmetsp:Transcript_9354/g.20040  ORF Transcript_9354/g.20040 Transcript_9354/m.20040 type:complete len:296 (+) Transcript_9354:218-1105(+)
MIIYTVIGKEADGSVLVESSHAGVEGNFPLIATQLLEKLCDDPNLVPIGNRKTFIHREDPESGGCGAGNFICGGGEGGGGGLWGMGTPSWFGGSDPSSSEGEGACGLDTYFHVLHGEAALYVCLSDDTGRQAGVNFNYLEDVQRDFAAMYTPNKINRANAYGMNKAFGPSIEKLSHHYNTNRSSMATDDRLVQLTAKIDDLKDVIGSNISMMMSRGENLSQLAVKSEQLEADASVFKKRSTTLKRKMWWEYVKANSVLICVAAVTLFFLSFLVCGVGWGRCIAKDEDNDGQEGGG